MSVRLAIIGDVHLHFNEHDVSYFNRSDYDLVLFVGDLVNYAPWRGAQVWSLIQQLNKPTLFMPGNHDGTNVFQLIAEVLGHSALAKVSGMGQTKSYRALTQSLSNATFCSYSLHPFEIGGFEFDIVAGRPFSMGGPNLSFRPYLRKVFKVDSIADSSLLINQQIDQSKHKNILFFAHNGPSGLGDKRDNIWGCDFKRTREILEIPTLKRPSHMLAAKTKTSSQSSPDICITD